MKSISTHVLDLSRGRPAAGVPVTLEFCHGGLKYVAVTDTDGRVSRLLPDGESLLLGTYRIAFDTHAYFSSQGIEAFYPEAAVMFAVRDLTAHYHIPLLLSPFGYSTYRGS
jgi:5-hydroxyisourate hydrolase